ncbi:M91 family zinc metallopeptidase [Catalinimonas niigatensis]|uniref:M91 family zinc metallopeptidase n=1 Tax=Catalinimonas niigatensis TaxID=1397264 RepID=UPI0026656CC1|nr:M91 family zinc metallopeptidase [Catalinimonas niigatensis]WPP49131.1 M91 family zinc metallopeptidase [Catalinimonas niigatensis]
MAFDTPTQYPGIIIRMQSANDSVLFPTLVNQALATIARTPTGSKLLNGIASRAGQQKFGYTVCIMRADMTYDKGCVTGWLGTNVAKRGQETEATTLGVGSVTAVKYNANMINSPDGARPSWVGLAHELIHAYYNLKGKGLPTGMLMNVKGTVEQEELATVGIGPGPQRSINENKIRHEARIPLRTTYGGK